MTRFKQGEVILIAFPFTDLSFAKKRPALIVSSDEYNDTHSDLIILAITSKVPPKLSSGEFLIPEEALRTAGLPKLSIIKTGKVITIHQDLADKKLGHLSDPLIRKVKEQFFDNFSRPE